MILRRRRKRAGLFLSLALVSKERKRERERERERESLLYSQVEEFFFAGSETKARKNERSSIEVIPIIVCSKITPLFVSNTPLLLLVIKKLLEFHISQILLYSILQNLQKSLLRLNRRVSRGVRRSSCCLIIRSKRE